MSQNRHFHIWVFERSLCDLHARDEASPVMEGEVVTACGPCLLVAECIHGQMHELVRRHAQPDETPAASVDVLRDTRWNKVIDLDDFGKWLAANYSYPEPAINHSDPYLGEEES